MENILEAMASYSIVAIIISLIALIVFFFVAANISNIRKNTDYIVSSLKRAENKDTKYKCRKCEKSFVGQLPACPECGQKLFW